MNTSGGIIGILLKTYPKVSETFILGEVLGLERCGLQLHIYSLRRPTDRAFHSTTRAVRAPVTYISPTNAFEFMRAIRAHLVVLFQSPRCYMETLGFLLRRKEGNRIIEFFEAGCLVEPLRDAGIVHLHAHFASEPAGVAELVKRLAGITFSISAHAKDIYLSLPGSLHRKLNDATFTVTCTEYNRRYLKSIAGLATPIFRMYHGIDSDRFRPVAMPVAASIPARPPLVLSVGRLREKKGFTVLIEACRRLVDAGCPLRCEIVGYGPEHGKLKRLIKRLNLTEVVSLIGKLTHDALIERYREATVFVLPSQIAHDGDRDGIPNVLLEAMAMQLPVVSTNVSGIPEVVEHQENGLLVPPQNTVVLGDAIRSLLEQPGLRARLGINARRKICKMFSIAANLQPIRDLLLAELHRFQEQPTGPDSGGQIYAKRA